MYSLFLVCGLSCKSKYCKALYVLLATGVLLAILIDHALMQTLQARLDLHQAANFITSAKQSIKVVAPFFKEKNSFILWLNISVAHFVLMEFLWKDKLIRYKSVLLGISSLFFVSSVILPYIIANESFIFYYKFYNIIRANITGDILPMSTNSIYNIETKKLRSVSVNSGKRNVVVLVVESLSSYKSAHFGNGIDNLTPNLDKIAQENIAFLNHYSNGYNTNSGLYSILTGRAYIHGGLSMFDDSFYTRALPKVFNTQGYKTSVFFSSADIGNLGEIYKKSGFDEFHDDKEKVYEGVERLTFNAVPDEYLLDNALDNIERYMSTKVKFMTLIMTSTTHGPYAMPKTHEESYDKTLLYTDKCIGGFVDKLEQKKFFEDGILIITGDHRAMLPVKVEEYNQWGYKSITRVPLVIVDKSIGSKQFNHITSHTSINPTIQYLAFGKADFYDYQELLLDEKEVPVVYQKLSPRDEVLVIESSSEENTVKLRGDYSKGTGNHGEKLVNLINWFKYKN